MLIDKVFKPIAAFILAAIMANCNDGCLPGYTQISPADAYAMEVSGCVAKYNSENMACAGDAGTMKVYLDCHEDAEDHLRSCRGMVDRKYLNYNSNGDYPGDFYPPSPR